MKTCSYCKTEVTDDAVFCPKCGKRIDAKNICQKCGAENVTDANYCIKCGNRVSAQLEEAHTKGTNDEPKDTNQTKSFVCRIVYLAIGIILSVALLGFMAMPIGQVDLSKTLENMMGQSTNNSKLYVEYTIFDSFVAITTPASKTVSDTYQDFSDSLDEDMLLLMDKYIDGQNLTAQERSELREGIKKINPLSLVYQPEESFELQRTGYVLLVVYSVLFLGLIALIIVNIVKLSTSFNKSVSNKDIVRSVLLFGAIIFLGLLAIYINQSMGFESGALIGGTIALGILLVANSLVYKILMKETRMSAVRIVKGSIITVGTLVIAILSFGTFLNYEYTTSNVNFGKTRVSDSESVSSLVGILDYPFDDILILDDGSSYRDILLALSTYGTKSSKEEFLKNYNSNVLALNGDLIENATFVIYMMGVSGLIAIGSLIFIAYLFAYGMSVLIFDNDNRRHMALSTVPLMLIQIVLVVFSAIISIYINIIAKRLGYDGFVNVTFGANQIVALAFVIVVLIIGLILRPKPFEKELVIE